MAIFIDDDELLEQEEVSVPAPVPDSPEREYRTQEQLMTSMLYNKEKPLQHIIQYIKGMNWEVTYFLQIRDVNDDTARLDINLAPGIQKYYRIKKLILKLSSGINSTDDIENLSGEAIINCGFTPNPNDLFVAKLTGGRIYIFNIENVEIKTHNMHKIYHVSFKLYATGDQDDGEILHDLNMKVMKEYTYDKDHLLDYSAPVILSTDYKKKKDLLETLPELTEYYFTNFISKHKNIIALPTKSSIFVDTYLNEFIFKIIERSSYPDLATLSNVQVDKLSRVKYTIWDAIAKRDIKLLKLCNRDLGFKISPYSITDISARRMNYLNINFLVGELNGSAPATADIIDLSTERDPNFQEPRLQDGCYVLSNSFYDLNLKEVGLLEDVLLRYLSYEILNIQHVDRLVNSYTSWSTVDQYYLIPILMVLIRDSVSNTFQSI